MSGNCKRDRDLGRKYESGNAKRKKKASWENYQTKISGSLDKFVSSSRNLTIENKVEDGGIIKSFSDTSGSSSSSASNLLIVQSDKSEPEEMEPIGQPMTDNVKVVFSNPTGTDIPVPEVEEPTSTQTSVSNDPGVWDYPISDKDRTCLVLHGPVRVQNITYPLDKNNRHFSNFYYTRILSNQEKQDRRYLVYSQKHDRVYCFACRLFATSNTSSLSDSGVNNWKNLGAYLKSHDTAPDHMASVLKWVELEKRLKKGLTVEDKLEKHREAERKKWRDILERVLAAIDYLAAHNLAFRGHRENLSSNHSGNFLGLIKLLAKFDPVLKVHVDQIQEEKLHTHYLGKNTQNELIELMGNHVKGTILNQIRESKYYSIILDCTRDVSRTEQMSLVLRYVNIHSGLIEESFLGFLPVESTTGENLAKCVMDELESLGLDINDCRGQGYDNGSNMRGDYSGVKTRILSVNSLAFFTPCGCHSWNLLLCDAASSCTKAKCFFGTLQRLYVLFSASSNRWSILKNKTNINITLKPLSDTRWECRVESVKAVRYQLKEVAECLDELSDSTNDSTTASECNSLRNEILSYDFIISLVVWYDVLVKVQFISKLWQRADMDLGSAINHLEKFLSWLVEYRVSGLVSAMITGNEIADELEIPKEFKKTRYRKKKTQFSYENEDELSSSAEDLFRTDFFLMVIDKITESTERRFVELKNYDSNFGFLYRLKLLKKTPDEELLKSCNRLQETLTKKSGSTSCSDIDSEGLYQELKMYSMTIPEDMNMTEILKNMIEDNLVDVYPNIYVALRVLLTTPVSVASAERSFSKLKLIKNYLRSTISQERLSSLSILSIERDVASNINFCDVIDQFSVSKSRKVSF